jgi:hypothetical protein
MRLLRGAAILTLLGITGFIFFSLRRERRVTPAHAPAPPSPGTPGEGRGEGPLEIAGVPTDGERVSPIR